MVFKLDKKYQITHEWYHQLLNGYKVITEEPRARKLIFDPAKQRTILEIGVYEGASTCWWSDNFLNHPDSRLYSVDPFTGNDEYRQNRASFPTLDHIEVIARSNVAKSNNAGKVDIRKGCSWDLFPALAQELKAGVDILYVDGEHTSNAVVRDLSLYYPLLKSGGALILDDYGNEEVKKGVDGALSAFGGIESAFFTGWQLWLVKA
jgi:predicted O-methyltransferase YrrM